MKTNNILNLSNDYGADAYPAAPYRFLNREYFIITYETDLNALKQVVPAPLEIIEPIVKYEFIRMPDSSGLGDYTESGQVIPVRFQGEEGLYVYSMFLDNFPAIAAGREIWGFPKKLGKPTLKVDSDALLGTLHYGETLIATGTMGFKFQTLDENAVKKSLETTPNFLLKRIPGANGKMQICELVKYYLTDIKMKGAWTGPATLDLRPHALAPVAELPVKKIISAMHFIADLTLPYGETVHDYLQK